MQANPSSPIDLPAAAVSALMDGEIVHAIRAVRHTQNLGFSEAKRMIERYIMCDPGLRRVWVQRRYAARNVLRRWTWSAFVVLALSLVVFEINH